jgi:hypothetical protein
MRRSMTRADGMLLAIALFVTSAPAPAQVRVNPTGVSVSTASATTVFLTYGGLRNERPVEALWCGELLSAAPAIGLRCDPSTIYGRLPARYDLSRLAAISFTDVMSIPPSVVRLAYQAAQRGATSTFFYVRRFQSAGGGPDEYVAVTCRLTGGGAHVPFSLTDVHFTFDGRDVLPFIAPNEVPPRIAANITYTGTGRLTGRWEIVLPGEALPELRDLVSEASLPIDQRPTQRRFTQLERFNIFLPPDGRVTLPGPDPRRMPSAVEGTYRVLLRIEATDDREADSDLGAAGAGVGIVHSGGVAGFPMPVLRYIVAGEGARTEHDIATRGVRLILPRDRDTLDASASFNVMWMPGAEDKPAFYRIEFQSDRGVALLSALLPRDARSYEAPRWLIARAGAGPLRWRVSGLATGGEPTQTTVWRSIRFSTTLQSHQTSGTSRGAQGSP